MSVRNRSVWDWLALVAKVALENEDFDHLLQQLPIDEDQKPMKATLKTRKLCDQLEKIVMKSVAQTQRKKTPSTPMVSESAVLPKEFRALITSMGGTHPVMVIQKTLHPSDVKKNEGRLSMPAQQCETKLGLTHDENKQLQLRDKGNLVGIRVRVIEPGLNQAQLKFKKWVYKNDSANFVLTTGWNDVVHRNKLTAGDGIQVWAFRIHGDLGFAVVKHNETKTRFALEWGAKRRRT